MHNPANRMIVPAYWAEASLKNRTKQKQVTIRRFGWSDVSQQEAETHAQERAEDALRRALSGEKKFLRREPKVAYNGAHGVPIREEIVSRHGDTVITRNSYGARCLNTPDVVFADIDYDDMQRPTFTYQAVMLAVLVLTLLLVLKNVWLALLGGVLGAIVIVPFSHKVLVALRGGKKAIARSRIQAFHKKHPDWKLRIYKTPAGLRVMVMQRSFAPSDPKIVEFFKALGVDRIYQRMCMNQQCFRARVSAKPWRIGIEAHMKPRPGTWPVAEDKLPMRTAWIETYEATAAQYAACSYVETLGKGITHPDVQHVQELHDELCGALTQCSLA